MSTLLSESGCQYIRPAAIIPEEQPTGDVMDLNLSSTAANPTGDGEGNEEFVRVLIIGSGPAGLSAALYAARADLDPVVLTGMELGGQVSLTYAVENYPGFPDGVGGMEMVDLFQKQAQRFGARIEFDLASEVDLSDRPFKVKTQNGKLYSAESLIITTGASAVHLDVPGENEGESFLDSLCRKCHHRASTR
jgi:thioredoxin reductase (NADPH)